tara:strand:- start:254 stop:376 length:123 start_codon:yes stop_codon:yes gene_type:complete
LQHYQAKKVKEREEKEDIEKRIQKRDEKEQRARDVKAAYV